MSTARYFERHRERPYWMSRSRALFIAAQDGEATAYLIDTNADPESVFEFARSAARHARWSQE